MGMGRCLGQSQVRRAVKTHNCDLCGTTIEKGIKYLTWTYLDDRPARFKAHLCCDEVADAVGLYDDEWNASDCPVFDHMRDHIFLDRPRASGFGGPPGYIDFRELLLLRAKVEEQAEFDTVFLQITREVLPRAECTCEKDPIWFHPVSGEFLCVEHWKEAT
jgi:hypothetical protein